MENASKDQVLVDALILKEKGNAAIKEGNFKEAALFYTQAVKIDPNNSSLYSNRSLAYLKLKYYSLAFTDALETIRLNPQWAKGYFRKAEVEAAVGLTEEAALSYTQTLQLQPQDASSVLASIKKVTDDQRRKREVRDKLPWVCCCIGVIIGVILVILDYVLLDHHSPRNPLLQVGTILTVACLSYIIARHYVMVEENDGRKQLRPPGYQDPDAEKQPWTVGCVCGIMIIFLDVTFIEVIGIKENPTKIVALIAAITGAGVGVSNIIYLVKYITKSSSHETIQVNCKLPFVCGCVGASILILSFVLDYIISEEPSQMSPFSKAVVIFAFSCIVWCGGKAYNMSEITYNKKLQKDYKDPGNLPEKLWSGGFAVGVFFIVIDCTVANVIGLGENPIRCVGFALSLAGSGYGLGCLLSYMKSFENEKEEDNTGAKDFIPVVEETQEKTSNKYTKAQARYRYKKGKM